MKPLPYLRNLALWLDEGANAVMGYNAHETISERAALARRAGKLWGCVLCRVLDWIAEDHCAKALVAVTTAPTEVLTDLE